MSCKSHKAGFQQPQASHALTAELKLIACNMPGASTEGSRIALPTYPSLPSFGAFDVLGVQETKDTQSVVPLLALLTRAND